MPVSLWLRGAAARLVQFGAAILLLASSAQASTTCFGSDAGAGVTERAAHYDWASPRDPAEVAANLSWKVDALSACATSDDALRAAFADLSVVIANYVSDPGCFGGDVDVTIRERQPHLDWATARSRQEVIDNLRWKAAAAMTCLARAGQNDYFADLSVAIATSAEGLGGGTAAPGTAVWQLGEVTFANATPYENAALRIDETQADANGGFMRITALNDGECAPGAGTPAGGELQRFLFRWVFDRDVSVLTFPDTVSARLSIEADGDVPCLDLNPIMQVIAGSPVLASKLEGERFYWRPEATGFHNGAPRDVTVISPESGLERSATAHAPFFKVSVWGFRGNRGMQLEATYPYTLVGAPAP